MVSRPVKLAAIALTLVLSVVALAQISLAFNPQPDPPGRYAFNPQPEPPGDYARHA